MFANVLDTNSFNRGVAMAVEEFRRWLITERQNRDWSQRELARRAGINYNSIAMVEAGDQKPTAKICEGIAKAFKLDVVEILKFSGVISTAVPVKPKTDPLTDKVTEIVKELPREKKATILEFVEFVAKKEEAH